jgi:hypothetical protein
MMMVVVVVVVVVVVMVAMIMRMVRAIGKLHAAGGPAFNLHIAFAAAANGTHCCLSLFFILMAAAGGHLPVFMVRGLFHFQFADAHFIATGHLYLMLAALRAGIKAGVDGHLLATGQAPAFTGLAHKVKARAIGQRVAADHFQAKIQCFHFHPGQLAYAQPYLFDPAEVLALAWSSSNWTMPSASDISCIFCFLAHAVCHTGVDQADLALPFCGRCIGQKTQAYPQYPFRVRMPQRGGSTR